MAFSTTEDEQWFTALPADLTATPETDRPAAAATQRRTDDAPEGSDGENENARNAGDDSERVVALPSSSGPQWAAALGDYTPDTPAPPRESMHGAVGVRTSQPSWIRRHRSSMAVTGSVAALVALVGGAALILGGPGDQVTAGVETSAGLQPVAAEVSTTETASSSAVVLSAEQWCAGQSGGTRAVASSTDPYLAAIARIEDAYYLTRDINAVNTQLGGGVVVEPADFAAAMAAIPAGTDHCVLTSPLAVGQYRVTVIERRPSGEEKRFTSAMTVQRAPDGTSASIVGIGQVPQ